MKRTFFRIKHKTTGHYVTGFDDARQAITYNPSEALGKKFDKDEMNRWLDDHVNAGFGLSWDEVQCFRYN